MLALIAAVALCAAPADKPKLVVTDLTVAGGLDASLGSALSEAVAQEISSRGVFTVVSSHEMTQLLGLERQKQLMGCDEDSASCVGEIAGALNARFVLTGTIAKLGQAYQLTLQMTDNEKARSVGRASRIVQSLDEFKAVLPYATAEATGVRPPEPPAKWPAYTGFALAALSAIGSVTTLLQALASETAIRREWDQGRSNPLVLRSLPQYRSDLADVQGQRTVAMFLAVGAGVFAVAATAYLYFTHQLPGSSNYAPLSSGGATTNFAW